MWASSTAELGDWICSLTCHIQRLPAESGLPKGDNTSFCG